MKHLRLFLALFTLLIGGASASAQTWTGNEVQNGTFFLYNVGAQKFLNNGDPNESWGTNAYLQAGFGLDVTLASIGEGVYTIETGIKNNDTDHYLSNSTWCDASAINWTFRTVEGETNVYQIIYNGQYLMANEALNDVEMVGDPGDRVTSTYWKLVSESDFKAAMQAKTYSSTDPMDVSVFIKGRSFARNDTRNSSWTTSRNGGNWTWIGSYNNKYFGNESWNNTFNVYQTITDLPEGTYEVRCSGFGTNGTTYIYGNTTSQLIQTDNSTDRGTSKESKWVAIHEDNAFAGQSTGTFTIGDGNLTLGIKRENNTGGDWAIWDEFRLYYYGLDLSEFAATLAAAVEAAEAVEGTVPTAVYNVLAAVVTDNNHSYTSASEYTAATNAIVEATNTAKALQPNYARYINVRNAVLAINDNIDVSEANSQAEAATTVEGIENAVLAVRTALADYLPTVTLGEGETIDLTDALIDNAAPGLSGNTDYWTNSDNPALQYNLYEFYNQPGATTKQTIATSLPAGNYKLTAIAFTRTDYEAKLSAGNNNTNIATVDRGTVNDRQQGNTWIANGNGVTDLIFDLANATSGLEIGLTADNANGDHWMCWRSFRLVYGDVFDSYTLVEGKMNADVAAAQTAAETNFNNNPTPDTYMALMDAIAAAQASVNAYANLGAVISKIDAALEAATSATESADVYNTIKTAYNNGTIADDDILTEIIEAYEAIIPVIKSQTAAQADFTFAIQNQSFEYGDMTGWTTVSSEDTGVRETSNPTYAATGSDGKYLFNTWWKGSPITQTVTDLPNGEYTLTVSVASDGATIYLLGNGEHNEGIETGGTYPSKDTFQETTFTFLVKDGTATIGVVSGADGTAGEHKDYIEEGYWWYKVDNFRLVKNRDLLPEEEFVEATPEDYAALSAAIIAAEGNTLGFEEGEFAPYNNVEAIAALNAAKAIDPEALNSQEDVQAATAALGNAVWTPNTKEVNAVYDGTFATAENNGAPAGWETTHENGLGGAYHARTFVLTSDMDNYDNLGAFGQGDGTRSGFYIRFDGTNSAQGTWYNYGKTDGYTMPLKASTTYYISLEAGAWGDNAYANKNLSVNIKDANNANVVATTLKTTERTNAGGKVDKLVYYFTTNEAGDYTLSLWNANGTNYAAIVSNIELFKAKPEIVTIKENFNGTTYSSEYPLDFTRAIDNGAKFFIITGVGNDGVCETTEVDKVPAGTGVYVEGDAGEYEVDIYTGSDFSSVTGNLLVGTGTETMELLSNETTTYYLYGKQSGKESFFRVGTTVARTVSAHKAYLEIPTNDPNSAKAMFFVGEGAATGINAVEKNLEGGDIFNLNGQKVNNVQKGVYIVNGKKVIFK